MQPAQTSSQPDRAAQAAQERLCAVLRQMEGVTVAFSGGVDSSYLLAAAIDCLGREAVLAVTVVSPLLTADDRAAAQAIAQQLGANHRLISADELQLPEIASNAADRCYHCKRHRFAMLQRLAEQEHLGIVVHGENVDDRGAYRPGSRAAAELGVRAPLAEVGLTKPEIRTLARQRGLPNWDRQADACLATRFPYGTTLDRAKLERVAAAERQIREVLGSLGTLRVRDHGDLARIELSTALMDRILVPAARNAVHQGLRALGYTYVTLDLAGYHMGSYDENL